MSKPFDKGLVASFGPEALETTRKSLDAAAQCFVDLLEQIEEFGEIDPELYAYETLSESLVCDYRRTQLRCNG
jgi:hypothetical protein